MDGEDDPVELLSQALLREYMHKKGFRATLAQFDVEQPRTSKSISSRLQMSRMLDLSPTGAAYTTFMEMIIEARLLLLKPANTTTDPARRPSATAAASAAPLSPGPESPRRKNKIYRMRSEIPSDEDPHSHSPPSGPSGTGTGSPQHSLGSTGLLSIPSLSLDGPHRPRASSKERPSGARRSPLRKYGPDAEALPSGPPQQRTPPRRPRPAFGSPHGQPKEVLLEDITEEEEAPPQRPPPLSAPVPAPAVAREAALGPHMGRQLKRLLFGDRPWASSWIRQGFHFSPHVPYGLVQNDGGPCGPLAVVQAYLLRDLLFGAADPAPDPLTLSSQQQFEALASAIASVLMNIAASATDRPPTVLLASLPRDELTSPSRQVVERFVVRECRSHAAVAAAVLERQPQFMQPRGHGLLSFLVSALLTKAGAAQDVDWAPLQQEMDFPDQPLVVEHGYSGQELLNLLLHGAAVSNVFDGVTELPGEQKGEVLRLRGIERPADLGFLTLFEHYGSCRVGDYLKNPKHPCWVVCSESHFSVLFVKEAVTPTASTFDIFYYDQLGMQDAEIRLTVDTTGASTSSVSPSDELVPPLDLVLRTKWPGASVNWNDTEPLL